MFVDHRTVNDLAGELDRALDEIGLPARVEPAGVRRDGFGELQLVVDGRTVVVAVTTRAELRPAAARDLPVFVSGRRPAAPDEGTESPDGDATDFGVVFADRLSERSREVLRDHGWGWLDRKRGNLRLWCPGLRLDAPLTPTVPIDASPRTRDPFTPAGRRLALWLLLHPDEPASPRAIAREVDISAGQVSNLLGALTAESLLRRDKTPLVPELFWALAEHWKPHRHALLSMPPVSELFAAPELRSAEWVITDPRAAAAMGAPLAVATDYPPDLYVPDQKSLTWILNRSTPAREYAQRIATVAIAPNELVFDDRYRRRDADEMWPLAHPIVVALDLAVDRGRGREVVDGWTPDPELEAPRVW